MRQITEEELFERFENHIDETYNRDDKIKIRNTPRSYNYIMNLWLNHGTAKNQGIEYNKEEDCYFVHE